MSYTWIAGGRRIGGRAAIAIAVAVVAAAALAGVGAVVFRSDHQGGEPVAAPPLPASPHGQVMDATGPVDPPSGSAQEQEDHPPCDCVEYQSTRCECTAESSCSCAPCTRGGEGDRCLEAWAASRGTIRGTINSPFARRTQGVVYVEGLTDHSYRLPRRHPTMDQINLEYTPHVLPILVGTTVDFPNSDQVRHNVYTTPESCCVFNLGTYDAGTVKSQEFPAVGVATLLCNVHAEMNGYIVVCPNPYFALSNSDATFEIRNVPPGSHRLTVWHERLQSATVEVNVVAGEVATVAFTELRRR